MTAYYNIAEMFLQTGKYQRAYEYYSLQYDAAVKISDGLYQYRALTNLGLAQHLQDKDQEAKELLLKAGDRGRKSAPPDEMCLTYYFLGEVYLNLAQFHEALVAADEALRTATLAGMDDDADKARLLKLRIRHRNGDRQALDEIIAISSNSGDISVLADVHYCLFKMTGKNEYRENALTALKKLCQNAPDHFNQTKIDELEIP